ncbi:MAG: hypothetical protein NWE91_05395 [Candidatus Bathyarchaeota archaeon]|nr:hypothetical protein [Candidatus Bathyarchaeota archaeon]
MSPRKSVSTGANIGIRYEQHINHLLKNKGLQPKKIVSAGATDSPNGFVDYHSINFPIEIKKDLSADFAQIELNWDIKKRFFYSKRSKNNEFISILKKEKFLDEINTRWSGIPRKFTRNFLTKNDRYRDLDEFPDIKREIKENLIEQFYNLKSPPIHYIQIGGYGFFCMGNDVAGLGMPRLIGKGTLRARVKTRNSRKNLYGFLVAIKLRSLKPSSYDIEEKNGRTFPFE